MSNSYGAVRFNDGTIKHFEYNGTVDVCNPILRNSIEEVSNNWRNSDWNYHDENCKEDEEVEILTTYGGGFSWTGRACKKCNLITDKLEPDYDTSKDGISDWYPDKKEYDKYFGD